MAHRLVGRVRGPFVRKDPGDVGVGGGVDELGLLVFGRGDAHGDDQGILAAERFDDGGVVVIVNLLDVHALGELGGAILAGDGRDYVFAGFEQGFGHGFATVAAGLVFMSVVKFN